MSEFALFALLFVAIAIGWFLGRRGASAPSESELPSQYYRGLNYLLDGRPDGAIDAFVNALEVNSETLETHITLGNVLRRKGEVERAVRIHQNLLARPSLPRAQVHQAHLELARDYISAGLLDRAERLLLDLVDESPEQRRASRRHLLEIYQSERDWGRAIEMAQELLPRKSLLGSAPSPIAPEQGQSVGVALAHFHCEMAGQKLDSGDYQGARAALQSALTQDKQCVRASIMLGDVELRSGNPKLAIKALKKVRNQDADMVPETVVALRSAYRELEDERGLHTYLRECLASNPGPALVIALAEDIRGSEGNESAAAFLTKELSHRPSLRGLASLVGLYLDGVEEGMQDKLNALRDLIARLAAERPTYQCSHCGFSGRQLHWFCPGCKYWGTIKAIQGNHAE